MFVEWRVSPETASAACDPLDDAESEPSTGSREKFDPMVYSTESRKTWRRAWARQGTGRGHAGRDARAPEGQRRTARRRGHTRGERAARAAKKTKTRQTTRQARMQDKTTISHARPRDSVTRRHTDTVGRHSSVCGYGASEGAHASGSAIRHSPTKVSPPGECRAPERTAL